MNNQRPNAAQLRWREEVRELGSVVSGKPTEEIHHCVGRTARHNKVDIGHWWILPLTMREHRGPDGIHASPARRELEKNLFLIVLARYELHFERPPPVPPEVIDAIQDWHR